MKPASPIGLANLGPLAQLKAGRLPERVLPVHAPGRLKLWLKSLRTRFPQADALYTEVRSLARVDEIDAVLRRHGIVDAEIARAG